ncbi:hypothetical protein AB1Y20_006999 [Prymnesium parvum]|uniref:non-specific serine/threonine protein kinase n=1 Tax=Prymnesium parvum TaxID=97485 RepID=A0AB34J1I2_PRYPA
MERYKPLKLLGKGSFGVVFLVREAGVGTSKLWVMKQIALAGLSSRDRRSAFLEVELLRELHHPHICSYRDSFVNRPTNQLCVLMTYCEGGDLHRRVQKVKQERKRFSEAVVLRWSCQLALALQYIHERHNLIHRDVKSQNTFLRADDSLMLGDFGVSIVLDSPTDLAKTCVGTPFYMCPELVRKQKYSNKADMWAFGIVIYELTTLSYAFDANNMQGLMSKILRGRYPPIPAHYSAELRALVDELLRTKAHERPSATQFLQRPVVRAALGGEAGASAPQGGEGGGCAKPAASGRGGEGGAPHARGGERHAACGGRGAGRGERDAAAQKEKLRQQLQQLEEQRRQLVMKRRNLCLKQKREAKRQPPHLPRRLARALALPARHTGHSLLSPHTFRMHCRGGQQPRVPNANVTKQLGDRPGDFVQPSSKARQPALQQRRPPPPPLVLRKPSPPALRAEERAQVAMAPPPQPMERREPPRRKMVQHEVVPSSRQAEQRRESQARGDEIQALIQQFLTDAKGPGAGAQPSKAEEQAMWNEFLCERGVMQAPPSPAEGKSAGSPHGVPPRLASQLSDAEAEAIVAEEVASLVAQEAAASMAEVAAEEEAARQARLANKSADELLDHTMAALLDFSPPATPNAANVRKPAPLPLEDFTAALHSVRWAATSRPSTSGSSGPVTVDGEGGEIDGVEVAEEDLDDEEWDAEELDADALLDGEAHLTAPQRRAALDELEATLGACELSIQAAAPLARRPSAFAPSLSPPTRLQLAIPSPLRSFTPPRPTCFQLLRATLAPEVPSERRTSREPAAMGPAAVDALLRTLPPARYADAPPPAGGGHTSSPQAHEERRRASSVEEDWTLTPGLARQQQQVQAALTEIDVTPRRLNDEGVQLELAHLVEGHWRDFDSSPGDDSRLEPASDEEDEDVDADGNMFEYRLKERDLRAECVKEIGEDLFVQVYEYLKVYGSDNTDFDEQMRRDLVSILGESKLKYWPLIDMYILSEDLEVD